jgi:hypothetical protein
MPMNCNRAGYDPVPAYLGELLRAFFHVLWDWLFNRLFLFALASWIIKRPM